MFISCSRLNYGPQKKWVQPKNFLKWPKIIFLLGFSDFWWFQSTSEPQKPPSRHLRHKNRPKNTKVTDIQPLKKDFGACVSQPNLFVTIREHQNPLSSNFGRGIFRLSQKTKKLLVIFSFCGISSKLSGWILDTLRD